VGAELHADEGAGGHTLAQLTPAQLYIDCFQNRGSPVILDDAEHLLDNRLGARLISALGDTGATKLMSYATSGRALGEVPQRFETTSPLCVIANRVTAHEDIQSRAVILHFDPTNVEAHRAAAGWFWDQEIHDWFGRHLRRLPPMDVRWYVTAYHDKRAGRDWRRLVLDTCECDRPSCVIQDLEGEPAYPTREDKARRFTEVMGKGKGASRATYFRIRRRLQEEQRLAVESVPPIRLRRTRPPGTPSLLELESLEVPQPPADEEPAPVDVPAREQFTQPIRGTGPAPQATPARVVLDDGLPWESPAQQDEEGDQ
jgi:hypothetical protein